MHTDSSASSTCLRFASAVECTATVLMPSSRQARRMRRAISPRLAMTIFSIIAVSGLDDEQRLAELHGLAILEQDGLYLARFFRLDLIHHFHGLDDAQHLADLDLIADLNERLGARGGGRVVSADHRGRGDMLLGARARRGAGRLIGRGRVLDHSWRA